MFEDLITASVGREGIIIKSVFFSLTLHSPDLIHMLLMNIHLRIFWACIHFKRGMIITNIFQRSRELLCNVSF